MDRQKQKFFDLRRKFTKEELRTIYQFCHHIERKGDLIRAFFGNCLYIFDDPDFEVNYRNANVH